MSHSPVRAALCGLMALVAASPALAAKDAVIAVVNGVEIHRSALDKLMEAQPQLKGAPINVIYEPLLNHLVSSELILIEARKDKLQDEPAFKAQMKDVEAQLLRKTFLSKAVSGQITDASLKTHYDKLIKDVPSKEEIHARHILVASEAEAKAVITEIKTGAKFADVAAKKSTDASKSRGGDLGFLPRDALVDAFAEAAMKLKPGEMTQTPVKTPFGWHVILFEGTRMAKPDFAEVKDEVRADLVEKLVQKVVEGLTAKATIQRFSPDGAPLAPKADSK
ncbi:MAG: peptidylprolyl isomerase [Alphaproteobacteria bacterium]|nr:peptidylprolyl isomerase [Alphaproteobacteria bacterium]MBF0130767.1 peptidylprolyl isomerase [Alphaproteobacteria bacterium]